MNKEKLIAEIVKLLAYQGDDGSLDDLAVKIEQNTQLTFHIKITRMYSYVVIQFKTLDALAKLFKTDQINLSDGDHSSGCETCDYGSSYEVNITIKGSPIVLS